MALTQIGEFFEIGEDVRSPALTVSNDGRLFANGIHFRSDFRIETTQYAPDGTYLSQTDLENTGTRNASPLDIVTLTNGNIAGIFSIGAGSFSPHVRVFDSAGAPLTDYMLVPGVDSDGSGTFGNFSIEADPTGGFVVGIGVDNTFASERATIYPGIFQGENVLRQSDVRIVEYDNDGDIATDPYFSNYVETIPTSFTGSQASLGHAVLMTVVSSALTVIRSISPVHS